MVPHPFQGQVVIVTGASSGIGASLAEQLCRQGAKVVIAARRAGRLEETAEKCRSAGGEVLAVPTDVSDEAQCQNLVEQTRLAYGRIDMLINNAGLGVGALFEDLPDLELFKQVMEVNFNGAVYCTYHALPYLKEAKGRLVAVSSVGGKAALPFNTPYISSKFAMHGFYETLRMELKQHGVSVTVVCPWWVKSEFHEAQLDKNGTRRGERGRAIYTKRMMTAGRCAQIVLQAAARRRREVILGLGPLAVWLKVLSPPLLEWLTNKMFLEPALRRARARQDQA